MTTLYRRFAALMLVAGSAAPALAHPGHVENDIASGLLHPLTGMDHLAAMVMVGLWSGLIAGRAYWALPLAFLAAMLGGFAYGILPHAGGTGAEAAIILSLLVLGGALALNRRAPVALAAGVAAVFGFAHGIAHGLGAPGGTASFGFVAGFLGSTALLHIAGLVVARRVSADGLRTAGMIGAGIGLLFAGAA